MDEINFYFSAQDLSGMRINNLKSNRQIWLGICYARLTMINPE
jgi:hypothetical protein